MEATSVWISVQPHWTEQFLATVFSRFPGFVKAAVIGTKGYGFIDFDTHKNAGAALQAMQDAPVPGDPTGARFRLKWGNAGAGTGSSASPPSTNATGAAGEHSIFVGDLPYDATDGDVVAFFQAVYPSCVSAHVVTDSATGKSRGYGFVRFTDAGEQARALTEMGGKQFGSRALRVGPATPKPDARRTPAPVPAPMAAPAGAPMPGAAPIPAWGPGPAAVGGAPYGFPAMPGAFPGVTAPFPGMVAPAAVPTPAADPARAAQIAAIAGQPFAPPPAVSEGNTTVFVGGLDKACSESELRFHFHRCGPVSSVKVLSDKGCGFVQFQYRAHAEAAIASLNGSVLGIGPLRLQWGKNAARNAMAAAATLPGAPAPAGFGVMGGHAHVGYGPGGFMAGGGGFPAGGFPMGMMAMPTLGAGGSGALPGMFGGMTPGAMGMMGQTPVGAVSSAMPTPGLPGAVSAAGEVNPGHTEVHALPLVSSVHNPWSFAAPEQKAASALWGELPGAGQAPAPTT